MAMPIEHPAAGSRERAAAIREPGGRRGFRQRRQRRFIVTSALAFAVFVIGATAILAWQWRVTTLEAAEKHERGLSIALSELMARSIESVDILLRSVAETIGSGDLADPAPAQRIHEVTRQRILRVPSLRALVVIHAAGRAVAV